MRNKEKEKNRNIKNTMNSVFEYNIFIINNQCKIKEKEHIKWKKRNFKSLDETSYS